MVSFFSVEDAPNHFGDVNAPFDSRHLETCEAVQLGQDLDGEAAHDYFGHSVALSSDGKTFAAGAIYDDGTGYNAGHVRVFRWNGNAWAQKGIDLDGEAVDDQFGWSVALSSDGDILAVGAFYSDGNGVNAGHARVFHWNGSAWAQRGDDLDGEAAGDMFGWFVALSSDGNNLAVGAKGNDANGVYAGHVRVFHWNGNAWAQRGDDLDGEAAEDNSGFSVALSSDGNILAVGSSYNDGNGNNAGSARVFHWNGNAWAQRGNDLDGEAADDYFGHSVALSSDGKTLAVGAKSNDGNGVNAGHARVFYWNGSAWAQRGDDLDGEAAGDEFGYSVALSSDGKTLAVGGVINGGNGIRSGHARVFSYQHCTDEVCVFRRCVAVRCNHQIPSYCLSSSLRIVLKFNLTSNSTSHAFFLSSIH